MRAYLSELGMPLSVFICAYGAGEQCTGMRLGSDARLEVPDWSRFTRRPRAWLRRAGPGGAGVRPLFPHRMPLKEVSSSLIESIVRPPASQFLTPSAPVRSR